MFVQFSAVKTCLLREIIPALLVEYAVEKEIDLPSPLREDLLFIKTLLKLLDPSPRAAHILAGALFTLSKLHPECNMVLPGHPVLVQFSDAKSVGFTTPHRKAVSMTSPVGNEWNTSSFLFFMFQRVIQRTGYIVNSNINDQFELLRWSQKALELRTSFLRVQGTHALMSSPQVKLKTASSLLDLGEVDIFVAHFRSSGLIVQHPVVVSGQEGGFVERALCYLKQAQWPRALEKAATQGVRMLEDSFSQPSKDQKIDGMRSWEAACAVSILCKVHLFERGQADLGPALVPLFGLSDVEVIRYWHKALTLTESAFMNLVHERLRPEIKPNRLHFFAEVRPDRRELLTPIALQP